MCLHLSLSASLLSLAEVWLSLVHLYVSSPGATARKGHPEGCAGDEKSQTGLSTWLPAEGLLCPLNLALGSSLDVSSS